RSRLPGSPSRRSATSRPSRTTDAVRASAVACNAFLEPWPDGRGLTLEMRQCGQGGPRFSKRMLDVMIQKNWQELIKPTKLDVVAGSDSARVASVVAEPLERGYGLTLGNTLRRVLLSSLQGAAITAIQ